MISMSSLESIVPRHLKGKTSGFPVTNRIIEMVNVIKSIGVGDEVRAKLLQCLDSITDAYAHEFKFEKRPSRDNINYRERQDD